MMAPSVVQAAADEDTYRLVRNCGLRLQSRRYETEAYEEVRPDVGCGHCSEWGHIEAQCPRTAARCGWCAEGLTTREHRCPVQGCRAKKATGANTPWPSARTARAPTSCRQTPARRRGRPAATQRGGGPPPPREGSEARPRRQKSHRPTPRRHRGAGWRWRRSTSPLRRRPWRSKGHEADQTEGG